MYPPPLLLVYLIKSKFTRKNRKRYHFYVKTVKKNSNKLAKASKKINEHYFLFFKKKSQLLAISDKSQK